MTSHRSSTSQSLSSLNATARALAGAAMLSLASLGAPTQAAELDIDRLVFDAFPLPDPDSDAPPPRYPTRFMNLPPPAAVRVAQQIQMPTPDGAPERAQAAVDAYLDAIAETQQEGSPFDQLLFEPYLSLGLGYQQLGDHEQAIAAFEKAEYISRINNGLFAPEQYAIIERMIASYVANGDLDAADQRRRYLYYLSSQHYGEESTEVVPSLTALADWNMGAFDYALKAGNNIGFVSTNSNLLGLTGTGPGQQMMPRVSNPRLLTPRGLAMSNLFAAQSQYYSAIVNLLRPHRLTSDQLQQLIDLEMRLVEAVFLGAHRAGILDDPVFYMGRRVSSSGSRLHLQEVAVNPISFKNGQAALERLQIYQNINANADPLQKALPAVSLGDWHLLFDRRNRARNLYISAAERMRAAGVSEEQINAVFEPTVPVQLPEFAPRPHSRRQFGILDQQPLDYDGWVDVKMRVSRFGSASRISFLDHSENVTPEVERRLRRVIRHAPFRPSLSAFLADEAQEFTLRYYFKEVPEAG